MAPLSQPRRRGGVHLGLSARALQVADDDQRVLERLERLQRRRQLEVRAGGRRRPRRHVGAVRHVDEAERATAGASRLRERRRGRHHRVEQRQRQRGAHAAQERPPRQRHLGDEHGDLLSAADYSRDATASRRLRPTFIRI